MTAFARKANVMVVYESNLNVSRKSLLLPHHKIHFCNAAETP